MHLHNQLRPKKGSQRAFQAFKNNVITMIALVSSPVLFFFFLQKKNKIIRIFLLMVVLMLGVSSATYAEGQNRISEIVFNEVQDTEIKKYRFLDMYLLDKHMPQKSKYIDLTLSIFEADEFKNSNLLFFKFEGSLYCGSLGCQHIIYQKRNSTYEPIYTVTAQKLYSLKCNKKNFLIVSDSNGYRLLEFPIDSFVPKDTLKFSDIKDIPNCSHLVSNNI